MGHRVNRIGTPHMISTVTPTTLTPLATDEFYFGDGEKSMNLNASWPSNYGGVVNKAGLTALTANRGVSVHTGIGADDVLGSDAALIEYDMFSMAMFSVPGGAVIPFGTMFPSIPAAGSVVTGDPSTALEFQEQRASAGSGELICIQAKGVLALHAGAIGLLGSSKFPGVGFHYYLEPGGNLTRSIQKIFLRRPKLDDGYPKYQDQLR